MNSLNILSAIGSTPPPSPSRSRAASESDLLKLNQSNTTPRSRSRLQAGDDADVGADSEPVREKADMARVDREDTLPNGNDAEAFDEKTPLLAQKQTIDTFGDVPTASRWLLPKRVAGAVMGAIRVVLTTITAPGRYVIACFFDENGHFSAMMPVYSIGRKLSRRRMRTQTSNEKAAAEMSEREARRGSQGRPRLKKPQKRSPSIASTSTAVTTDTDYDTDRPGTATENDTPSKHTRSKSIASSTEEIAPARRSIRIKLHNEEALKRRPKKAPARANSKASTADQASIEAAAKAIKSPTSPASSAKMTKFPRAPVPPRPLVPRRQPSYTKAGAAQSGPHEKTLIIDLDETLIHSMARGGRFTQGHMIEVKLQHAMGVGGATIGPQVPILYSVQKRPNCDEFLRKVSKWYNLIAFTASVQEYADPVIDWLELERKYFSGRYYRQHCTWRNGAYIKDLAQVEPDLSKVMILDNSPISYAFHEDNAIPIEGWISDPTDNDLLHLIPMLEALQYVTDVRAFLALRMGEPQTL